MTTRVLILGSTGSIGTQALEVIAANRDRFSVVGLGAGGGNVDLLARQIADWQLPGSAVAVADRVAADKVALAAGVEGIVSGPDAMVELIEKTGADVVLNAVVGSLGLRPTLATLATGARLALANKESLVAGGALVLAAAAPGQIVAVDSEHSAIAQCLRGGSAAEVDRLVLTASGGPFFGWDAQQLKDVTPEQAGKHPTWSMGPMITLNSATLVNKALEVIEAHLLFDVPYDRIDVTVHRQSIVHSMVTFVDGATIAKASPPSMKLPIALALGWPDRIPGASQACDFSQASTWTFEPVDNAVFPAIDLAREAGTRGGSLTAVFNAANEAAADGFFAGAIAFPRIVDIVGEVLAAADQWTADPGTVDEVLAADAWARERARQLVAGALT
ncbi:1-deoxy-D-xylulose 5-phosphate reductoisomerase [Williamsia limnetica]|uniref:1-deoxy-D-xylulose 5-phosphate reductoisomerase n=1 Tax=Williamsia limnetica TaxID=882452 RepID=A0A318RGF6_WILLI|nr:1-deoxy-D-xylulose-5-phosphate reductoisomerase [Williamsia limnetica]PYE13323.1 1-deoxy-D-xylulose 5-phosphate reductoisomerase [Williamsia limnetica]